MPEMKNNVWADIAGLSMYLVSRLSDVKYLSNIITNELGWKDIFVFHEENNLYKDGMNNKKKL